jgi:hypothetical protein
MEVGTHTEQLEAMTAQPDFLEVYADKELTVFGITGRLQDLAGMCPVDLSDPRVTLEAKNEFVVKVANESGMEIAPEHESYFSQVIDKHGQERKFTVATSDNSHMPERQSERQRLDASKHTAEPKARDQPTKQVQPAARKHTVAESQIRLDGANARQAERGADVAQKEVVSLNVGSTTLASRLHASSYRRSLESTLDQSKAVVHFEANKNVVSTENAVGVAVGGRAKEMSRKGQEARKPGLQIYEEHDALAPRATPEIVKAAEELEMVSTGELADIGETTLHELRLIEQHVLEELASALEGSAHTELSAFENDTEDPPTDIAELTLPVVISRDISAVEQTTWNDVVGEEPSEFCDDFTHALQALILESELAQNSEVNNPTEITKVSFGGNRRADEGKPKSELVLPMPAFGSIVTERLAELKDEEKRTVAPALKEIMGTVLAIELLVTEEAELAVVEEAMAQLEEEVALLFDELGIAYAAEELEQFIRLLLSPGFRPLQQTSAEAVIDLENEGTHEAKWQLAQLFTNNLNEVEYETGRLLGKLALFYASSRNRSKLAAA